MSRLRFILSSLYYHRRSNGAVALGVVAGAAVLTGALLVGDSVRGSLRHLALDRLGWIDDALVVDRFFRVELADELARSKSLPTEFQDVVPAIYLPGSVSQPDTGARANRVTLLSYDRLDLGTEVDRLALADSDVVLNEPLAAELHVKAGDEVIVRLPTPSDIPRESALGRKTETITNRRLKVRGIVPAQGLGAFSLLPTQRLPLNAYLSLKTLQTALEQPGKVNALFVGSGDASVIPAVEDDRQLPAALKPTLADYGLFVQETKRGYLNLGSQRMMLDEEARMSALTAFDKDHPQQVITYLANTIAVGNKEIPYSTISALQLAAEPPLGPFKTPDGKVIQPLADDEILLNDWAARELEAKPGDEVRIAYFEPESTHGEARERWATFKLKAIVALEGAAADPDFTPTLRGVTDQKSMTDWNPPFPFDSQRVRPQDEKYWDDHRATPKAFISLLAGAKLWSSRFGSVTSIRLVPTKTLTAETAAARRPDPIAMGFEFRPVKRLALEASQGTTPFNALFLGFSLFIIAAAVMLVALLFRLGIERRAREIGILLATGFTPHQVGHLLLAEGAIVAVIGSLLGMLGGVAYAWLMLAGLRTWWLAAISTPFLELHVTPASLAIGTLSSIVVSLAAIIWALWLLRQITPRQMLAGQAQESATLRRTGGHASRALAWGGFVLAAVCSLAALGLGGMAQAGAFFGAGSCALTAALAAIWRRIARGSTGSIVSTGPARLVRLAIRNGARNPGRSTLTIGLVASASFLLVAVSAFRLEPPAALEKRVSGTGGFMLVAESDQPIYPDLNSADGRADLGFPTRASRTLAAAHVFACRLQAGEDASCLNLYQTRQPRVIGVSRDFVERGGFAWAGSAAQTDAERKNPWLLLHRAFKPITNDAHGHDQLVPVILDEATAMYSLHVGLGDRYTIDDGHGGKLHMQVVGLLAGSVLQGMLVIDERWFLFFFPEVSGYRYFLVDCAPENQQAVDEALERNLGDYGFDAQSTGQRLAGLLAVQNTYLSTFQSLGGLGLLLGTLGLATVQLRNVLERRGELALMRAVGFRRRTLAELVLLESAALLLAGLGVGVLTAFIAIAPQLTGAGASIPWLSLAGTLGLVLAAGLLASAGAARSVIVAPLLAALRGE